MLLTIRSKVRFAGLFMAMLCTLGPVAGLLVAGALSQAMEDSAAGASIMRSHMEADMMHDALRSDVLAALLAAQQGRQDQMPAIQTVLDEHSETFRAAIRRNQETAVDPDMVEALHTVDAPLEQYIVAAHALVDLAGRDGAAAEAALPGFTAVFTELEGRMAAVSERIEGALAASKARADFLAVAGMVVMAGVILLGVVMSLVMMRVSVRAVTAPIGVLDDEMAALAEGRTDVVLTSADRADELGAVGRSVVALQALIVERALKEARQQDHARAESAERDRAEAAAREEQRQRTEEAQQAAARQQALVVNAMAEGMDHLMRGDLTHRITEAFPHGYEKLRDDFNAALQGLEQTLASVDANAVAIRTGAGEVAQAADDLSRRTEQQAASLEETAAALEEITATVHRSAEGARAAADAVGETRKETETSGRVVGEAVSAMDAIHAASNQMSQIISVIDEIAFQTNLLALNAGVEAARAGDAGRGFAVVASEVRALAQRSAEAAKEINTLISDSGRQVTLGVDRVREAGSTLDRIARRVADVGALITEMAAASAEQSTALREVNTAIGQMDQVTQQNAAMVEETTAASHALAQETETLSRSVGRFRLSDRGGQRSNRLRSSMPQVAA
ncbi:methyl-accepting chemotaxis protein [Brevundimonas subvibrioides]|uniref:Methyl-accepting chemotaxis sensory transducer n=1 Tax=Brevundimonas subvibrioides (strain ATCC 15264 / DSM 4735 / LMG 14903 / NBRC 16000 / CB 81) TaxID=633149 RepID=D9QFQ7_BRESC|nr:methyl-accepting chemotaxis protein [Brevundimonas subvibrioides]ADL00621.1 methyl-accepting chemotaxis sensory transducer [Brevundimonas subvibrioides ATCC 15264]